MGQHPVVGSNSRTGERVQEGRAYALVRNCNFQSIGYCVNIGADLHQQFRRCTQAPQAQGASAQHRQWGRTWSRVVAGKLLGLQSNGNWISV